MSVARKNYRVALLVKDTSNHQQRMINGILGWHREHGHWQIHTSGFMPLMDYRELDAWSGDGLIAMVDDQRQYRQILRKGLPAVNCSARLPTPKIASVLSDNEAIGRLAAEHLAENGYRRFAFVGETRFMHDLLRMQGFREALQKRGFSCTRIEPVFKKRTHYLYTEAEVDIRRLSAELARMARPVGILAAHDDLGGWVLKACKYAGIAVPDEMAVVGVNNHIWLCELASPHLSSISQDAERMGYEAAALLDRMLSGSPTPTQPLLIPPRGLIMRGSSDALASEDACLARAILFIRNHGTENLDVPAVVRHANISRRALELRFRKHLNRSIGEEIERVRMDQACRMLTETDLPIYEVAAQSGYRNYHTFCLAFQRSRRMAPGAYRIANRRPDRRQPGA